MSETDLSELKRKKIAMVMSGGVVKAAAWHLGVALALDELGFSFKSNVNANKSMGNDDQTPSLEVSTYVGSSAGAMIAIYLAIGYTPQEIIHSTLGYKNNALKPISYKDILALRNPIKKPAPSIVYKPFEGLPFGVKHILKPIAGISGIFTTSGIEKYLKKNVLNIRHFHEFHPDVFIVATQLDHSRKVIFGKYNYPNPTHDSTAVYYTNSPIAEAAAASMSVPPLFSPYPIQNPLTNQIDYYIDGEIRETLSTHVASDNQCEFIISSYTHTPYHYQEEIGSLINYGLPAICLQAIYLLIEKKIVAARARRETAKDILVTIDDYMRNEKFSNRQRKQITAILERKLNFDPKIKYIDINPKHRNYKLFFANSFSLNSNVSSLAVKMGYKRTLEVFKNQEWEN